MCLSILLSYAHCMLGTRITTEQPTSFDRTSRRQHLTSPEDFLFNDLAMPLQASTLQCPDSETPEQDNLHISSHMTHFEQST